MNYLPDSFLISVTFYSMGLYCLFIFLWIAMKFLQLVYDMLKIMYSDFHGNILKDVEYITKSVRGLVRTFGQCM